MDIFKNKQPVLAMFITMSIHKMAWLSLSTIMDITDLKM